MKLPHVLCQVLVELGLENGALVRRQVIHNRNIRAAGWAQLRAKTKPPPSAHPSPCLGCETRGCSSTEPLLPPGSQQRGYPSCSDTREADAGCAKPAAARAPQPRERCALLLPVPTAARSGPSIGSSAGMGSVVSWLSCWQDQAALPGCYRPRRGKQLVLQSVVTAQARLLR